MVGKTFERLKVKSKDLTPLVFYGDNEYSKKKILENTIKEVLGNNVSDLNYETYYSDEIDLTSILEKAYIESFFTSKRIIVIKFLSIKYLEDLSDADKKALLEYIKLPSNNALLILLIYGDTFRKTKGFLNELAKYIEITELKLPKEQESIFFIKDKCKKFCKNIAKDAIDILLEKSGNDFLNLENELNKLFLYVKDKNYIDAKDIENVVVDSKTREIFELTTFVGLKKLNDSLIILNNIFKQEEDASVILVSIAIHFRRIWITKSLVAKGKRRFDIAKALKVKEGSVYYILKQINNFSYDDLAGNFEKLLKADLKIKTSNIPSKFILEGLIIDLCNS